MAKKNAPNVERVALRLPSEDLSEFRRLCGDATVVTANPFILSEYIRLSARMLAASMRSFDEVVARYYVKLVDAESLSELIQWMHGNALTMISRSSEPMVHWRGVNIVSGAKKSKWRYVWILSDGSRVCFGFLTVWDDDFESALVKSYGLDLKQGEPLPLSILECIEAGAVSSGEYVFGGGYV
jgi:hypothetical protein